MGTDMLRIEDEDGLMCECSIDEFFKANADDLEVIEAGRVDWLRVGQSMTFGGGAAPIVTVTRIS